MLIPFPGILFLPCLPCLTVHSSGSRLGFFPLANLPWPFFLQTKLNVSPVGSLSALSHQLPFWMGLLISVSAFLIREWVSCVSVDLIIFYPRSSNILLAHKCLMNIYWMQEYRQSSLYQVEIKIFQSSTQFSMHLLNSYYVHRFMQVVKFIFLSWRKVRV